MPEQSTKPVIFLAFANSSANPLPNLAEEYHRLEAIGKQAEQKGHCELVVAPYATVDDILGTFQDARYRGRIALFHYAGHADSYELLLQGANGQPAVADAGGLAAFLGHQSDLQLVFLNGCSTQPQVQGLLAAGVAVVIATSQAIDDRVATDFAARFYQFLADGDSIGVAFEKAQAAVQTTRGSNTRHLYAVSSKDARGADRFPWDRYVRPGAEAVLRWNLPDAANDPFFGLPPIPEGYYQCLPDNPFRGLTWFAAEHAALFFGRGYQIRELYQQLVAPHTPPLILFYGQSGVGKSSLLAAGLTPRLESSHTIRYLRRDQQQGLLGTLQAGLLDKAGATTLADAWTVIEARNKRPLLVILDQAEEVFTRPNPEQPHELSDFLGAIQALGADPERWPQGKLILGFRKEWLAEVKRQVAEHKLPHTELFLQRLDKRGVIEAVAGPTRLPALQAKYRLAVTDELPGLIADDLLADPGSAVAPTLQILLTKLCEAASQKSYDQPTLDAELYAELRKRGLGLGDILDQQMAELGRRQPEVVASGLALDVLAYHTTPLGTAEERTREELRQTYAHRQDVLEPLVQECGNLFLLVDAARNEPAKPPASRLAHDTWAPLVRRRIDESDALGQRARRILENRVVDWQPGQIGTTLDEQDLELVQQGVEGMRCVTSDESRLIKASQQQSKNRRRRRRAAWGLSIAAAILLVAFLLFQYITAEKRALEAHSLALANSAQKAADLGDYDLALALAMEAARTIPERMPDIHRVVINIAHISPRFMESLVPTTPPEVERGLKSLAYFTPGLTRRNLGGHGASVTSVAYHPTKSNIAVSAAKDGTVFMWDLSSGSKHPLEWYIAPVRSLAFGPDGSQLIIGYEDGVLQLGEIESGRRWRVEAHSGPVAAVAISPAGDQALSGGTDGRVILWALKSDGMERLWIFSDHTDEVTDVAFSPTAPLVVSGSRDGNVFIINIGDGTIRAPLLKDNAGIVSLAISTDGKRIFTSADGAGYGGFSSCLWAIESISSSGASNECLDYPPYGGQPGHIGSVTSAAFSPDGNYVVSASEDQSVILWNGLLGKDRNALQHYYPGHRQAITSVAFSPDGTHILSGARDGTVRLWDLRSAAETYRLHAGRFALSPDGHTVLFGYDRGIYLWDVEQRNDPRLVVSTDLVDSTVAMSFSPNGATALLGLASGDICKVDVATSEFHCFQNVESRRVIDIAFNPEDSSQAVVGSYCGDPHGSRPDCRDTLVLWDVNRELPLHSFDGHTGSVRAVAFNSKGDSLISGSSDLTIKLWDVRNRELRHTYRGHASTVGDVAFSPSGEKVLSGSADATLRLWDINNPEQEPRLYVGHTTPIVAAAFGRDGRVVLSGANDSLRFWDVRTGEELAQIPGHNGSLLQAALLRNDNMLISQNRSPNNALSVWTLPPESLSEMVNWTVENRYIRDFTCEERAEYQIEPLCSN